MRRVLILACCLLLAACYSAGKRGGESALAVYDLGPSVPRSALPSQSELAVEVRAPMWMDSLGINYRLLYLEPARLRDYTQARWAGSPAQLIEQRLIRQLGARPSGQGRAACVLRIDIDEFVQLFADSASSSGLLQGRALLLDRRRAPLKVHDFRIAKPAMSADSRGGVAALTAAVDQLGLELAAWASAAEGGGSAAACSN